MTAFPGEHVRLVMKRKVDGHEAQGAPDRKRLPYQDVRSAFLERLGCPPKFLSMVMQLHEDQRGQVKNSNDLSEPFPIFNLVKQGCVLAPTLFIIFFSMMLQGPRKTSVLKISSTFDTARMVACSSYDAYMPTPRP